MNFNGKLPPQLSQSKKRKKTFQPPILSGIQTRPRLYEEMGADNFHDDEQTPSSEELASMKEVENDLYIEMGADNFPDDEQTLSSEELASMKEVENDLYIEMGSDNFPDDEQTLSSEELASMKEVENDLYIEMGADNFPDDEQTLSSAERALLEYMEIGLYEEIGADNLIESKKSTVILNDNNNLGGEIKRDFIWKIVDMFIDQFHFAYFGGLLHLYNGKYYEALTSHNAKVFMIKQLEKWGFRINSLYDIEAIYKLIVVEPSIQANTLKDTKWLINFQNGIYDISSDEFFSHSPEYSFNYVINGNYHIHMDPYYMSKHFFSSYLDYISGDDEDFILMFSEVFGYCLSELIEAKCGFVFLGVPNSGKTLAINLLVHLIGKEFCSSVAMQDLGKRFLTAELFGKKVNTCSELGDSILSDIGPFKALTGGDYIQAERKNEHPFTFLCTAKLVFATNNMPLIKSPDLSGAFYDRLLIIPFNHTVQKKDQDKFLLQKIVSFDSDFLVFWAVEGLKRLVKNNFQFTPCLASKRVLDSFRKSNNNAIEFINEECTLDIEARVFTEDLYNAYLCYCERSKFKQNSILSRNDFINFITSEYHLKKKKLRIGRDNRNGIIGLELKLEGR